MYFLILPSDEVIPAFRNEPEKKTLKGSFAGTWKLKVKKNDTGHRMKNRGL